MNFDTQDRLRELERVTSELTRATRYIPVRPADVFDAQFIRGTADELILAGASGPVTFGAGSSGSPANATGHPIWKGATVWVDPGRRYIVSSDAATLLWGQWDESGSKTNIESYTITHANGNGYDGTGFTHAVAGTIADPASISSEVTADKPWALFATGESPVLTIINRSDIGTDTAGTPWTGWPGPDPTTGVAPGIAFYAEVDKSDHVTSSDATFNFKNTTAIFGTAPGTGSCSNTAAQAFIHEEKIVVLGNSAGAFKAVKVIKNLATALVNGAVTKGDGTFSLDGFEQRNGPVPSTATCLNQPPQAYDDNEKVLVELLPTGNWIVNERVKDARFAGVYIGMITATIPVATQNGTAITSTPGFTTDAVTLMDWTDSTFAQLEALLDDTDAPLVLRGGNLSETPVRASTGEPITCLGNVYGDISSAAAAVSSDAVFIPVDKDLRGLPGYVKATPQLPGHEEDDGDFKLEEIRFWLKKLQGYLAANNQSIGKDADDEPEWQDDTTDCPEE